MLTRHFLKTLVIFMGMIAIGLVGVFLVSFFGDSQSTESATQVEK